MNESDNSLGKSVSDVEDDDEENNETESQEESSINLQCESETRIPVVAVVVAR